VVLDANQTLAGIAIHRPLRVWSLRAAQQDDITRGSCGTGFFKLQVGAVEVPLERTLH